MYAFAEVFLARRAGADRKQRWRRAFDAANLGLAKTHSVGLRKDLIGLQLWLEAKLADKRADAALLYRAGLGGLAATRGGDPIDLLQKDAVERVAAMDASGVAA